MGKHIIGENGISYTKGTDGIYYPDLKLPEGEDYEIGRYGNMRLEYLKNIAKGCIWICWQAENLMGICTNVMRNAVQGWNFSQNR